MFIVSFINVVYYYKCREMKRKLGKHSGKLKKEAVESPKLVAVKSPVIQHVRMKPIPGYDQIFKPPRKVLRDPSKKYGKEALRLDFNSQYHTFMSNKRLLKAWLKEEGFYARAPNLKTDREARKALKNLISLKQSSLAALNFDSITFRWQEEDIFVEAKSMLQYARKVDGGNPEEVEREESDFEDLKVESLVVHVDTSATSTYVFNYHCNVVEC